jgi:hypothetical protein
VKTCFTFVGYRADFHEGHGATQSNNSPVLVMSNSAIRQCGYSQRTVKANSHMPYRAHAVPMPRKFTHAVLRPCPAVVSFVKFRVVAGKIRTANLLPTSSSSNNLRETPPVSRRKPNVARSPTGRRETADVNSHMPYRAHAVPMPR